MNLNTLAAEEADYKSGSLPVALYPNVMRREKDGKQTFYARPIIRKHLSMEDIASDMVVEGVNGGMTREQIVSIWKNINCAVLDRVANSCSVDTGLCLCSKGNSVRPQIANIRDLESGEAGILTPGGFLEITGSNLTIAGKDESVGLYFESEDNPDNTAVLGVKKMGTNSPSKLACVVPATLAAGSYRIKIVTQFMNSKVQRKKPLTFVHDTPLTVISA